jgi:hypothetical protein
MELRIVNENPNYPPVKLIEPTKLGYIHLAAVVQPRQAPFMPIGYEKAKLLERLKQLAQQLERLEEIEKVTVFHAIVMAPPSGYVKQHRDSIHLPRYDIVVLIETTSPETALQMQKMTEYAELVDALRSKASDLHIVVARNVKRVGDVEKRRKGVFLFNYFVGEDSQVTLALWDYLAGWYAVETRMDNSTLLLPLEGERSDYTIINYARWDGLLSFMWQQLTKKSFRTYMLTNLDVNQVGAMPILYHLA